MPFRYLTRINVANQMKNYFLTALLFCLYHSTNAQPKPEDESRQNFLIKHRWTVSLDYQNIIELSRQSNFTTVEKPIRQLVPTVGYYVGKKTIVGLGIPVGFQSNDGTYYGMAPTAPGPAHAATYRTRELGLMPYVQQFIGTGRVRPFIGASYTFLQRRLTYDVPDVPKAIAYTEVQAIPSVFAGLTYFVCPRLGIDAMIRYKRERSNYHGVYSIIYAPYTDFSANEQQLYSANIGVRYIL